MSEEPKSKCEHNATELTSPDSRNEVQEHSSFDDSAIITEDFLLDEDTVPYGEDEKKKTNIKSIFNELEKALKENKTEEASTDNEKVITKRKASCESETTEENEEEEDSTPEVAAETSEATEQPKKVLKLNESYPTKINKPTPEKSTPKIINDKIANETANGKKLSQLSQMERLELRAQKFALNKNINGAQKQQPPEAAAAATATINPKNNTKTNRIIDGSVDINDPKQVELLKKRAERFGCVVSSKIAQFDDAEKLRKRCERFGLENKAATGTAIKPTHKNNFKSKKRHARLARFENKLKYRVTNRKNVFQPKSKGVKSAMQRSKQR